MKNSFSFIIIIALALTLILIAIAYYLFSKISASEIDNKDITSSNDTLRSHGVTDLATKLSFLSQDLSIVWPTEWQQLGLDTAGCQLTTRHCQVNQESCLDLSQLTNGKFQLPTDPTRGSEGKTGYAVRKTDGKLEIINCYTEAEVAKQQELRF
ncbi:MAG: hypothetical protein COY81_05405 [Candidatus Pacebacteria bacterium CG_4_10_14_0_8_um_filter_43_12]|nr:MAG: hypothetical protein COU66_00165 [Candidatus Pacebacteria bacterium CG10_big_fil_rev_8_21_14_0_10_44_11]PIY78914.1 MAG: hypothetical protein COY81_05405 [Candidatus Pacebacteria bacterium CG_4_10_14_0_8_um_filter_43_12]